jgi:hypothetical protein
MYEGEGKYLYKWQVGGSNDERHHWFIFRYTSVNGDYQVRDEHGNGVQRYKGKYVVYRTKKEATKALKEIEMGYDDGADITDILGDLTNNVTPINKVRSSAEQRIRQEEEAIARAERNIARAEARLEKLEKFPQVDDFPEETVIFFYKKFTPYSQKYTYTALKVNGSWYTSGPQAAGVPFRWVDLVDFIAKSPLEPEVWIVSLWERLV